MVVVPGWGGGSGNKGPDDSMTLSAGAVKQPVFLGFFPHFARELSLALSPQGRFLPLLCSAPAARDKRHPLRGWLQRCPGGETHSAFRCRLGLCCSGRLTRTGALVWLAETILLSLQTLALVVVNAAGPPPSLPGPEIPQSSGTKLAYDCVIKQQRRAGRKHAGDLLVQNSSREQLYLPLW